LTPVLAIVLLQEEWEEEDLEVLEDQEGQEEDHLQEEDLKEDASRDKRTSLMLGSIIITGT